MRYINLKKEARKDPYESITSFSCGPNFILNRQSTFKSMIKDQGVIFWFRFWLTFCLYPGCRELRKLQEQYPNLRNRVNIQIHQGFLQGSDEEASNYCLELANKQTKYLNSRISDRKKENNRPAIDIFQECSEMAFSASIGTLFYTWLIANTTNSINQSYWSTPDEYLDEKFKPGILEAYLIDKWDESLFTLLDLKDDKTPQWLKKLHRGAFNTTDYNLLKINESQIKMLKVFLKAYKKQKKTQIIANDESLSKKCNESEKLFEAFQGLDYKNDLNNRKDENNHLAAIKKLKRRQCAYCQNYEYIYAKFKKCKRCENENWIYPRCYCSDICLVEHWFKVHQEEHTKWSNSINAIQPLNKVCDIDLYKFFDV